MIANKALKLVCRSIIKIYQLITAGVLESVLSLYPSQSWDTSILPVLSSYGEPFMDVVCRDSCDGHDVGRVSMLPFINFEKCLLHPPSSEVVTTDLISLFLLTYLTLPGFLSSKKEEKSFHDRDIHKKIDFHMTVNETKKPMINIF